ncbi:hypothetical protein RRG08_060583 [Elysia crispata]|uniref:RING-CH-type domain-containing protein n=1 Tax=Elysia crispata TaxID=231223 RepID=A0AAE1ANU8_9GAST|nr:hypothetical protein RRG08_060583 [Elysia crispata]
MAFQRYHRNDHVNSDKRIASSLEPLCEHCVFETHSGDSVAGEAEQDALLPNNKYVEPESEVPATESKLSARTKCDVAQTLCRKEKHSWPPTTAVESRHSSSGEETACRICQEDDLYEKLVSPCLCSGTVGFVHISCLNTWLQVTSRTSCELCGYPFPVIKRKAPISEYLRNPRANMDLPNLLCDLVCLMILTPLLFTSVYLSSTGTLRYESLGQAGSLCAVITLLVALVLVYVAWASLAIIYHLRVLRSWRERHSSVSLIRESQISSTRSSARKARSKGANRSHPASGGPRAKSDVQQPVVEQSSYNSGRDTAILLAPINRLSGWIRVNNRVAVRTLQQV